MRGAPPSLSGTPERVREQLEELLPRAAVVGARGERASVRLSRGAPPGEGDEARVLARESHDTRQPFGLCAETYTAATSAP
ncbi:hypothetical protein [Sorangium sp. So ce1151]|uniref:hypothetical protein n=1 Tax=Sorangium sp. So ce1151 TaxID=3133332 RepID=UPI003F5E5AED